MSGLPVIPSQGTASAFAAVCAFLLPFSSALTSCTAAFQASCRALVTCSSVFFGCGSIVCAVTCKSVITVLLILYVASSSSYSVPPRLISSFCNAGKDAAACVTIAISCVVPLILTSRRPFCVSVVAGNVACIVSASITNTRPRITPRPDVIFICVPPIAETTQPSTTPLSAIRKSYKSASSFGVTFAPAFCFISTLMPVPSFQFLEFYQGQRAHTQKRICACSASFRIP